MNISQNSFLATSWHYDPTKPYRCYEIMPCVLPMGLLVFPTLTIQKTVYYNSTTDFDSNISRTVAFNTPLPHPIGKVYGSSGYAPLLPKFSFIVY